jgi:hypothetical protein
VMAVRAALRGREACDDHIGAKFADDAHHVAKYLFAIPDAQRLVRALGEPKIRGAREELLRAVDFARGQQFLSANHAQSRAELAAEHILAAVAACQR